MAGRAIAVVGAGIGGLAAALALAQAGHLVTILERAPVLSEVGAGLQLSPNATFCLNRLGVLKRLAGVAVEPEALRIHSARRGDEPLTELPLGASVRRRFGAPYLVVHRADLQAALLAAARDEPSIGIALDTRVLDHADHARGVTVAAFAGDRPVDFHADAVIYADGVHSTARGHLGGAAARSSGRVAHRAVIAAGDVAPALRAGPAVWMGSRTHLVHYPVHGGREVNLVAVAPDDLAAPTWAAPADASAVLGHFAKWPDAARHLLDAARTWTRWPLLEVAADGPWVRGRAALLGDAAHAMLPFAAQGAAMAIEDAVVLAEALRDTSDVAAALAAYERARRGRSVAVQRLARANGRAYHLGGPAAAVRDLAIAARPPKALVERQAWVWAWRPPTGARRATQSRTA